MTWNYRVIKKIHKDEKYTEEYYEIHEVYYDEDGKMHAWSENPCSMFGTSLEELKSDGGYFMEALNKPTIEVKKKDNKEYLEEIK